MSRKEVSYNKTGINTLPDDKPSVYEIKTEAGKPNYVGVAHGGRVRERISEHIGEIPGKTVRILQCDSMKDARKTETRLIAKREPKYNRQGK